MSDIPALQTEIDLFIETSIGGSRGYIIETHSEHLILRILRRIRETSGGHPNNGIPVTGDDVAVYYLTQQDGHTTARKIDIDRSGEFIQPWPDDFFEIDFYERFAR